MISHPDYQANDPRQKWELTDSGEISADLDRLEARLRDGEQRIAEAQALAVDTTDWEAFYHRMFADAEALYRRLAEGGA